MRELELKVENFIKHQGRMRLVDEIICIGHGKCVCGATARSAWPLCRNGLIDPLLTVELVAQSAGVQMGWEVRNEMMHGGDGLLVGVRRASFSTEAIPVGAALKITVSVLTIHGGYATLQGTVRSGELTFGDVEVQVFRP